MTIYIACRVIYNPYILILLTIYIAIYGHVLCNPIILILLQYS